MPWAAAAAVVGAGISAYASGSAADKQSEAAGDANALQKYIFDQQQANQEPWRQAGIGGLNQLQYLMGLSTNGAGGGTAPKVETEAELRARLSPRFTSTSITGAPGSTVVSPWGNGGNLPNDGQINQAQQTTSVDQVKLNAAIQAQMKQQQTALDRYNTQAQAAAGKDPNYGSLMDKFGMSDFQADPGYQFRMEEGQKALERSAAAKGGLFSGSAIKDTLRFGQGLGAQEYGAAFDRFNVQNANTFNRLASISGIGQTAANQTGAAMQNYGNNASNNILGAGNAQAAGYVGAANGISGGISQGISSYQNNQLMNRLFPSGGGSYASTGGGTSGFGTGSSFGNQDMGQYL